MRCLTRAGRGRGSGRTALSGKLTVLLPHALRFGLAWRPRRLLGLDLRGRNSYSLNMKTVVSEKGQVTIPKPLRDRLGIRPGQVLDFREVRGRLVAAKAAAHDPVEQVYGILKLDRPTDAIIASLRGQGPPA